MGTTEKVRDTIKSLTDQEFGVASNPEFLKEGAAIEDFLKPDRVVIGVEDESVGSVLRELYSPFMRSADRTIVVLPSGLLKCRSTPQTRCLPPEYRL